MIDDQYDICNIEWVPVPSYHQGVCVKYKAVHAEEPTAETVSYGYVDIVQGVADTTKLDTSIKEVPLPTIPDVHDIACIKEMWRIAEKKETVGPNSLSLAEIIFYNNCLSIMVQYYEVRNDYWAQCKSILTPTEKEKES